MKAIEFEALDREVDAAEAKLREANRRLEESLLERAPGEEWDYAALFIEWKAANDRAQELRPRWLAKQLAGAK